MEDCVVGAGGGGRTGGGRSYRRGPVVPASGGRRYCPTPRQPRRIASSSCSPTAAVIEAGKEVSGIGLFCRRRRSAVLATVVGGIAPRR